MRPAGLALVALSLAPFACAARAEPPQAPAVQGAQGSETPAAQDPGIDAGRPAPSAAVIPFEQFDARPRAAPPASSVGAGSFGTRPSVLSPGGAPPAALELTELITGTGPTAQPGRNITVQYVGVGWTSGCSFDASWDRGQPFAFALGGHQVIAGWEQGVTGMRVGGRRRVVIPPSLGYGNQGMGTCLPANETLIFVIDLLGVR